MTSSPAGSGHARSDSRFELKYLLHHTEVRRLAETMAPHVRSDPHGGADGRYRVSSLYYDSPGLRCYWEKVDGEKARRKVRIRTYGDRPEVGFLEIKERYDQTVRKRRVRAPLDRLLDAMDRIARSGRTDETGPVYDEVTFLVRSLRLKPCVVVTYDRAAFFDRYRSDFRITVDRAVRCSDLAPDLRKRPIRGRFVVPPTLMIVEIKFDDTLPRWLCGVLNCLDAQVRRISKYCYAVESRGLHRLR